jgi:hypothetical protein
MPSSIITHGSVRFIDIPEYFLERYAQEIDNWARHVKTIGLVKSIVLREGYLADLSPDPEQGAQLIQVKLKCQPWYPTPHLRVSKGVEISPLEGRDATLIALHCEKMKAAGIPAKAVLQEPARPWLPFMPAKVWDPPQM